MLHVLRSNIRLLNDWFNDSVVAFHAETQTSNGIILDFEARGYAGSDLNAIAIEGDIKTAQSMRLVADRNLQRNPRPIGSGGTRKMDGEPVRRPTDSGESASLAPGNRYGKTRDKAGSHSLSFLSYFLQCERQTLSSYEGQRGAAKPPHRSGPQDHRVESG